MPSHSYQEDLDYTNCVAGQPGCNCRLLGENRDDTITAVDVPRGIVRLSNLSNMYREAYPRGTTEPTSPNTFAQLRTDARRRSAVNSDELRFTLNSYTRATSTMQASIPVLRFRGEPPRYTDEAFSYNEPQIRALFDGMPNYAGMWKDEFRDEIWAEKQANWLKGWSKMWTQLGQAHEAKVFNQEVSLVNGELEIS